MFKLFGAFMILLSGTALGFSKSIELKRRWDSLSRIIYSLQIMENEISYGRCGMDIIMKKIESLNGLKFEKKQFQNAGECFMSAVGQKELCLKKGDTEIIKCFCETLGTFDSVHQIKSIRNTLKNLEFLSEEAKSEFYKYGRMYRSIGPLGGALAVVILM